MSRQYSSRRDYPRREPEGMHSAPRRTQGVQKKTAGVSSQDSYAACYFRDHPDVKIDTTDPATKLKQFEESLDNYELDDNQKFQLLIRSKSMIYLIYGEDSPEAFKIHAKLGAFYNETHRPQSALRHLQKAHEIAQRQNLDQKDLILVAVDTAEAHLAMRDDNKQESQKHIQQANECIKQIHNYETDDLDLRYRCELVYARVISAGKHPEKSFKQYEHAMQTLREKLNGEPDTQLAKLYIEMCEVAEKIGDNDRKIGYAEQAYKTFLSLEMYVSAVECAKKYPGPYAQQQDMPADMGYYDDAYLSQNYGYQQPQTREYQPNDEYQPTEDYQQTYSSRQSYDNQQTYDNYQTTNDNYQTTNDNYQTTNDSYQTTNDNYQTTNDSYQTTNDNYQTTNDNYQTTNDSYQTTNDSYQTTNDNYQTTNDNYQTTNDSYQAAEETHSHEEAHEEHHENEEQGGGLSLIQRMADGLVPEEQRSQKAEEAHDEHNESEHHSETHDEEQPHEENHNEEDAHQENEQEHVETTEEQQHVEETKEEEPAEPAQEQPNEETTDEHGTEQTEEQQPAEPAEPAEEQQPNEHTEEQQPAEETKDEPAQ